MKHAITAILATALLTVGACAEQSAGTPPPVPMGCTLSQAAGLQGYLGCMNPYGGADLCCLNEDNEEAPYICWDEPGLAPGGCDENPFDPNGGATGTGGGTGPWCAAECPDDMNGTCPGHAEWEKGIMIWGVYQSNDDGNFYSITQADPVCSSQPICFSYEDPDDIPGLNASMTQDLMQACNALTGGELSALGLPATAGGGANGWDRIDHVCVLGSSVEVDIAGQTFTDNAGVSETTCLGDWVYEGSCGPSDCPIDQGADSTGADSSSGGPGAYDCDPLTSSDVVVNLRSDPRTLTVRGDAAALFVEDAYAPMLFCADALMSTGLKIWDLPTSSFLVGWGLAEDDVIHSVDGATTGITDAMINAVNSGGPFDVEIARGTTIIDYTVEFIAP